MSRTSGVVALKSIAAYRGGLLFEPDTRDLRIEVEEAFGPNRRVILGEPPYHLTWRRMIEYFLVAAAEEAAKLRLPLQFHTGLGDTDLILNDSNPIHLGRLLECNAFRPGWDVFKRTPIVLLHCYPYVREAAYLANVYSNVYLDLSLTIPFTAHGGTQAVLEALELAPISKMMLATDALSIPEIFYVAALGCRRSLSEALETLISGGWLSENDAEAAAERMLHGNAEALYGKIAHSPSV
jgi:predicted TIM-barrel fold metal-dependent hydrolase